MENRFWEFYLVRYLSGTIFGVIILFVLALNYKCEINEVLFSKSCKDATFFYNLLFVTTNDIELSNLELNIDGKVVEFNNFVSGASQGQIRMKTDGLTVLSAIIIGIFGFLYMYLSSMLILVLHAIRLVIYPLMKKNKFLNSIFYFYADLSLLRSKRAKGSSRKGLNEDNNTGNTHLSEYIESYRHLREHGNAFAIILSEIIFSIWLIWFSFSIVSIVIWVLVGSIAWLIGSYLEIRMVKESRRFLHEK